MLWLDVVVAGIGSLAALLTAGQGLRVWWSPYRLREALSHEATILDQLRNDEVREELRGSMTLRTAYCGAAGDGTLRPERAHGRS